MGTVMATGAVSVTASPTPIITSVLTPATGGLARTTQQGTVTPMASITARDRQDVGSTLELKWSGQRVASEDLVAVVTEAVADFTAEVVAEALTEEVEEVTVGERWLKDPSDDLPALAVKRLFEFVSGSFIRVSRRRGKEER
jgi:hypothetical protein